MQFGEMFRNTQAHTELMQVSVGFNYFFFDNASAIVKAGCPWKNQNFQNTYLPLTTCIETDYNRTSTSPKRPRPLYNRHFFVLEDSPYIDSCLNLSKIATSVQQQWPLKHVPTPKVTARQRPVFTVTDEKVKNVA